MMMRARDCASKPYFFFLSRSLRPNHRTLTPVIPYHHFRHVRNVFFPLLLEIYRAGNILRQLLRFSYKKQPFFITRI
jgi:hypothetical protein